MKQAVRFIALALALGMVIPLTARGQFFFMENPVVGEKAPDFTLRNLEGEDVNYNEYRDGKKSIIFFWATWCPHCRTALQELNTGRNEIERLGIRLAVVDTGESEKVVRRFMKKKKIDLPVLLDQDQSVSRQFHLIGVPTFVFVDEDRVVRKVEHSLPEDILSYFKRKESKR